VETVQSDIASEKPGFFDVFREGMCRLVSWSSPQKGMSESIYSCNVFNDLDSRYLIFQTVKERGKVLYFLEYLAMFLINVIKNCGVQLICDKVDSISHCKCHHVFNNFLFC
jgi:hypothetical protein